MCGEGRKVRDSDSKKRPVGNELGKKFRKYS